MSFSLFADLLKDEDLRATEVPTRTVRLDTDPKLADRHVPGSPLWRRTEPNNDPALAPSSPTTSPTGSPHAKGDDLRLRRGDTLFGTLDKAPGKTGLLIVSGGNEIRIGAHRGMALLAQRLAARRDSGVPLRPAGNRRFDGREWRFSVVLPRHRLCGGDIQRGGGGSNDWLRSAIATRRPHWRCSGRPPGSTG